eukprot:TRINITY_DN26448_c0_g1_i1.p3 TRINITY_DN26448_c0_g1~~TRINITY_DN26448_c0_g1_i1.p3  ORF type:complete len:124 (-),score=5.70 TRINITY_DN26448_c0_g1_i1:415-786(-)
MAPVPDSSNEWTVRAKHSRRVSRGSKTLQIRQKKKAEPKIKEVRYTADNVRLKANTPKSIFHKLNTQDVEVTAIAKDGSKVEGKVDIVNENRISFTSQKNVNGAKFIVVGKVKVNRDFGKKTV